MLRAGRALVKMNTGLVTVLAKILGAAIFRLRYIRNGSEGRGADAFYHVSHPPVGYQNPLRTPLHIHIYIYIYIFDIITISMINSSSVIITIGSWPQANPAPGHLETGDRHPSKRAISHERSGPGAVLIRFFGSWGGGVHRGSPIWTSVPRRRE